MRCFYKQKEITRKMIKVKREKRKKYKDIKTTSAFFPSASPFFVLLYIIFYNIYNIYTLVLTISSVGVLCFVIGSIKNSGMSGTTEMAALKNVSVCGKKPLIKLNWPHN